MTGKRKAILVAIIGLALILVVVTGALAWYGYDSNSYSRHIARAEKYFSTGDYSSAILEYQRAIERDPSNENAYLRLADVYMAQGDTSMAQTVLTNGLNRTGSSRISDALNVYLDTGVTGAVDIVLGDEDVDNEMILLADGQGINTTLLSAIGSTEYNDLRLRYSVTSASSSDGGCVVRVSSFGANLYYDRKSTDSSGTKPVGSAFAKYANLDDIMYLFGRKASMSAEELTSFGAENVGTVDDASHGRVITFVSGSCMINAATDANGNIVSGAWHEIIPLISSGQDIADGSCETSGRIKSQTTGNTVPDAELRFRKGRNQTYGDIVQTVKTDAFGSYLAHLDPGDYTVEVQCTGYTTEFFGVFVAYADNTSLADIYISPLLRAGQIRIVLEWGSSPSDLDSHLEGTTSSGSHIHTFYGQQKEVRNGETIAELDLDDTDGYGPETTTIYDSDGVYNFYIVDFTNSGTMSSSGAIVKIYLPDQSAPIEVPICGGLGNEWDVCTIDHGQVTVNNRRR